MGMQKPRDACGDRVAFVVGLINLPAYKTLLSRRDFCLICFSGTGQ